ncbi:DUF3108 domain-containing protein [Henriciella barbarensis]|uniref:DUF3108 domain-containing protein n=1 Tax=Henriciella barbarensis TaxID=86342 RepID=A0A399R2J8_9PROT|nr:DUF3108 domain-containing protein [Henriciella barbarensis]RIJ24087.1 DUF3108 domain-containing protein [Henriciella barbarensis]
MKKLIAATSLVALATAGLSSAQSTSAAATVSPLGEVRAGEPMRLVYEVKATAWALFIPITGRANFRMDLQPDTYSINGVVKTTGLADILVNYDMRLAASGYVRDDRLEPYAYVSQNRDGKKNRRVEMTYGASDVAMTAKPAFGNLGEPPATPAQKLEAADPLTAFLGHAFTPRPADGNPCGGPMKIFDGRQLTHLHFENAGLKQVKTDAYRGEAYECHVSMDKIAGYDADEINAKETLTGIDGPLRMWMAPMDNGTYMPVKIQADTDAIGSVTLQVSKLRYEPIPEPSNEG